MNNRAGAVRPGSRSASVAAMNGDVQRARDIHLQLLPLHKQLFVEANPIPVKWALQRMGRCGPGIRLPLVPLTPASQLIVEAALQECGVL